MKAKEVLKRYAAGERNFRRMNLRGANFKGQTLVGADFREADIRGTNFRNANLQRAKFNGAKAGLQKRWVVILLLSSWTLAALSGICSLWTTVLVRLVFDSSSLNQITGWTSFVVLLLFYFITFRRGILAGFGAVIVAAAVAGFSTGVIAGTIAGAVAVAGVVATAVAIAGAVGGAVTFTVAVTLGGIVAVAVTAVVAVTGAVAVAATGAVAVAGKVVVAGELPVAVAAAVAAVGVLLSAFISWRAFKGDPRDVWIRTTAIAFAAIGGTCFRGANLTDADFTGATLKSTDFRESILTRTCWKDANKLDRVRPGNTILAQPEVQKLLRSGDGYKKSYEGMTLRGANLMGANLDRANLKYADLSEAILTQANLEGANLTETNAVGADFTGAWLTGACLAAWNIDSTTKLENVNCRYVFLLEYPNRKGSRERRPHDPDKDFEPGDFAKLYSSIMNTVQILLRNGVNREAFYAAFQNLMKEQPELSWDSIQGIEKKGKDVLVTVEVPEEADKGKIERQFVETYELRLEAAKTQGRLEAAEQHNQDLKDILLKTITEKQDKQTVIQNIHHQGDTQLTSSPG